VIRLYVIVEGRTEEIIANKVLVPHLSTLGVYPTVHSERGGSRWTRWRNHIASWMRHDQKPEARFTTMFDLYALPKDFPGKVAHAAVSDTARRVELLEQAMLDDLGDRRLVPYLQRHEVEALVLAGLDRLANLLPEQRKGIEQLRDAIGSLSPEDVNDGTATAPSKRLAQHVPGYDKTLHGPIVAEDVGLAGLRAQCPRFHRWIEKLEVLGTPQGP
jgi:uncharacterized protein DUF4276